MRQWINFIAQFIKKIYICVYRITNVLILSSSEIWIDTNGTRNVKQSVTEISKVNIPWLKINKRKCSRYQFF